MKFQDPNATIELLNALSLVSKETLAMLKAAQLLKDKFPVGTDLTTTDFWVKHIVLGFVYGYDARQIQKQQRLLKLIGDRVKSLCDTQQACVKLQNVARNKDINNE